MLNSLLELSRWVWVRGGGGREWRADGGRGGELICACALGRLRARRPARAEAANRRPAARGQVGSAQLWPRHVLTPHEYVGGHRPKRPSGGHDPPSVSQFNPPTQNDCRTLARPAPRFLPSPAKTLHQRRSPRAHGARRRCIQSGGGLWESDNGWPLGPRGGPGARAWGHGW